MKLRVAKKVFLNIARPGRRIRTSTVYRSIKRLKKVEPRTFWAMAIKLGHFRYEHIVGQRVLVDRQGRLVDGQHRVAAILKH